MKRHLVLLFTWKVIDSQVWFACTTDFHCRGRKRQCEKLLETVRGKERERKQGEGTREEKRDAERMETGGRGEGGTAGIESRACVGRNLDHCARLVLSVPTRHLIFWLLINFLA